MNDSDDEAPTLVSHSESHQQEQCPVTILSGFLGAGKTTLIQYILRSPDHGKRIAVIENEFGGGSDGLSIESLIARDGLNNDSSLQDLIELPNGCVCCTVKDSLVVTLENLLLRRPDIDYILIECSGMANPGPIASLFWLDAPLHSRLRLDGIVTLVDAVHIEQQLLDTYEAAQQIAYADRILLNKVDLVDDVAPLCSRLRKGTAAPIRPTSYANVPDLDWILNARCYECNEELEDGIASIDGAKDRIQKQHRHYHDHEGDDSCQTCRHTQFVSTITIFRENAVDLEKVNKWLAEILWPEQDERTSVLMERIIQHGSEQDPHSAATMTNRQTVYRVKGVLLVRGEDQERPHIVQAVHDLWEIEQAHNSWTMEPCCKLIVIGRHLNEDELRQGFASC